jgi:hypothetical protein
MTRQIFIAAAVLASALFTPPAFAQSELAVQNAVMVAKVCPAKWESPECLKSVSQVTLSMAANYAGGLKDSGKTADSETIKQHCAAATAATQQNYPAYAMQSAFTECANTIADVVKTSGMTPDLSQYQLLGGAILCLQKHAGCADIENGLKAYAK